MEITYQLEKNDYLNYFWFATKRVPALKRQMLLRFFGLPLFNLVALYIFPSSLVPYLLNVFGVAAAWIAYLWWAQRQAVITLAQSRPDSFGLHTLSLQLDGLYNQTSVLDTRVKWQNITEVAENAQMIVLFLSPRFGFIVPKRAFADPAQAQAFFELARAYRQGVLDGTQPMLQPALPVSWPPAPQRIL